MKKIEIESYEPIEGPNGVYFKVTKRTEDYSDNQVRHSDLCTICGFPSYPECRNWCQNEQWEREKQTENRD